MPDEDGDSNSPSSSANGSAGGGGGFHNNNNMAVSTPSPSRSRSMGSRNGSRDVVVRPRTVTPTASSSSSSHVVDGPPHLQQPHLDTSWEVVDRGIYGATPPPMHGVTGASRAQKLKARVPTPTQTRLPKTTLGYSSFIEQRSAVRRSVSLDEAEYGHDDDHDDDEDMPMDERMDRGGRKANPLRPLTTVAVEYKQNGNSNLYHTRNDNSNGSFHSARSAMSLLDAGSEASPAAATYRSMTPTKEVSDILSLNSEDMGSTGVGRMIAALQAGSTSRPGDLSREERVLWDALQTCMVNDRNTHVAKRRNLELCLQESTAQLGDMHTRESQLEMELNMTRARMIELEEQMANRAMSEQHEMNEEESDDDVGRSSGETATVAQLELQVQAMQEELRAKEDLLEKQQDDHDAAVRAIQRVLADVTTEKDKMQEEFEEQMKKLRQSFEEEKSRSHTLKDTDTAGSSAEDKDKEVQSLTSVPAVEGVEKIKTALRASEQEKQKALREADKKTRRALVLEREIKAVSMELGDAEKRATQFVAEKDALQSKITGLEAELATLKNQNNVLQKEKEELQAGTTNAETLLEQAQEAVKDAETKADHAMKAAADARKQVHSKSCTPESDAPETETPAPETTDDTEEQKERPVPESSPVSSEVHESLQKTLAETSSSLETSKKIIASLESANGSLAADLRSKLKAKEDELAVIQRESDERKRRLDSLATELRDLQRKQGDIDAADRRTKSQVIKQRALMGHLETSLADLQSAVVVHEASSTSGVSDGSSMDEISEILGDTLYAVKLTLEATEQFVEDYDDMSTANTEVSLKSDVGRHLDAIIRNDREAASQDLRKQLDQKRIAVKRLEEALKKQNEEMRKLRSQFDVRARGSAGGTEQMRAEIESLRNQVSTNLEVLAKKERELSVLRSSLNVDDNDAGYISDDASDDEDDNVDRQATVSSPAKLDGYGPADAEALATILSQTSGSIDVPGRAREMEALKNEMLTIKSEKESAAKMLQSERESLANAKMIISSLENANKQMMEDLRSRLQESNTAIASLLDKSMEHEKIAEKLKEEVERLKKEKEEAERKLGAEKGKARQQIPSVECESAGTAMKTDSPLEEKKDEVEAADQEI